MVNARGEHILWYEILHCSPPAANLSPPSSLLHTLYVLLLLLYCPSGSSHSDSGVSDLQSKLKYSFIVAVFRYLIIYISIM